MKFSLMDEHEVRSFAHANRALVESVISPDAKAVHEEEDFFGESFPAAMFLDFAKSLAEFLGAAVTVTKVISGTAELFKWVRDVLSRSNDTPSTNATLSERILILVFEAFVNRKAGIREDAMRTILDVEPQVLVQELQYLERRGTGTWKYMRPTS